MNEKIIGIILGIVFTIIIMAISVALTLFYIYYKQPEFLCNLCECINHWIIIS